MIGAFPITRPGAGQKRRVVLLKPAPGFFYQFNSTNNGEKIWAQAMTAFGLMRLDRTARPERRTCYSLTRRMPTSGCHRYPTYRNQNPMTTNERLATHFGVAWAGKKETPTTQKEKA